MNNKNPDCFKIFYTKHVNRKKKTYNEGILVCKEKSAKLYDTDGQCILSFKNNIKPILD